MKARRLAFPCALLAMLVSVMVACSSRYGENEPLPDAAPPPDGAVDAGASDAPNEAAVPFCNMHPGAPLCADFDRGDPIAFGFTNLVGDVRLDSTSTVSPPSSARFVATPTMPAFLAAELFGGGLEVVQRITFDIKLEPPAASSKVQVVFWSATEDSFGCSFQLESLGSSARMVLSNQNDSAVPVDDISPMAAFPVPGQWSHVSVLLRSVMAGSISVTVKIGSVTALDQATRCPGLSAKPRVQLGLVPAVGGELEARYDNLLIEAN